MSKHIPVPPELQHLIEKREQESDRRGAKAGGKAARQERRKGDRRRKPRKSDSDK